MFEFLCYITAISFITFILGLDRRIVFLILSKALSKLPGLNVLSNGKIN